MPERVLRKYGEQAIIDFTLFQTDGVNFKSDATHDAGDTKISKDEATEVDTSNGFVDTGTGYSLTLDSDEMQAKRLFIPIVDQYTKQWLDDYIMVETYGHTDAQQAFNLDADLSTATESWKFKDIDIHNDAGIGLTVTSDTTTAVSLVAGGTDGHALDATGAGSGSGFLIKAGTTDAHGIEVLGSGTGDGIRTRTETGSGIRAEAFATGGKGIYAKGIASAGMMIECTGAGYGLYCVGGTGGSGIYTTSTGGGDGISAIGNGAGNGFYASGGSTGHGIYGRATGSSRSALNLWASGSSGNGISALGGGPGAGFRATGGSSGPGILVEGTADAGLDIRGGAGVFPGVSITGGSAGNGIDVSTTNGHGLNIVSNGGTKHAIRAIASSGVGAFLGGSTAGLETDASSGVGVRITGSSDGINVTGSGGSGVYVSGASYGAQLLATSAHGLYINSSGGYGMQVRSTANHAIQLTGGPASSSLDATSGGNGFDIRAGSTGTGFSVTGGTVSGTGMQIGANLGRALNISSVDSNGAAALYIASGGTNGKGMLVAANDGHALELSCAGANKRAIYALSYDSDAILLSSPGSAGSGLRIATASGPGIHSVSSGGPAIYAQTIGGAYAGIQAEGVGTAPGLLVEGGAVANGAEFVAGVNGNGHGIDSSGHGTGAGIYAEGGATGPGLDVRGGSTSGVGVNVATTDGEGVKITADSNSTGMLVQGKNALELLVDSNNGSSLLTNSTGLAITNSYGFLIQGTGAGVGILVQNPGPSGTGDGIRVDGGYNGGRALVLGGTPHAGDATAVVITGAGAAPALQVIGGATGHGAEFFGGATSGDGVKFIGGGTLGSGLKVERGALVKGRGSEGTVVGVGGKALTVYGYQDSAVNITCQGTVAGFPGQGMVHITGVDGLSALSLSAQQGTQAALYIEGGLAYGGPFGPSSPAVHLARSGIDSGYGPGLLIDGIGSGPGVHINGGASGHGVKIVGNGGANGLHLDSTGGLSLSAYEIGTPPTLFDGTSNPSMYAMLTAMSDSSGGSDFVAVNDSLASISANSGGIVGTVDANLISIDGQVTTGNNATLNLKQLNISNNSGSAILAYSTGGNGHGMDASGNGTGAGLYLRGGSGLDLDAEETTGLLKLTTTVDGQTLEYIYELNMARVNGEYDVDVPGAGDITMRKRDNSTPLTVVNVTPSGRTRTS